MIEKIEFYEIPSYQMYFKTLSDISLAFLENPSLLNNLGLNKVYGADKLRPYNNCYWSKVHNPKIAFIPVNVTLNLENLSSHNKATRLRINYNLKVNLQYEYTRITPEVKIPGEIYVPQTKTIINETISPPHYVFVQKTTSETKEFLDPLLIDCTGSFYLPPYTKDFVAYFSIKKHNYPVLTSPTKT